jgi:glutamate dehydrogenase/leucine dehydrogenase
LLGHYAANHQGAVVFPRNRIFSIEAEILIPGARTLVLNEENARLTKYKLVCPISNTPIALGGEQALAKRHVYSTVK